MTKSEWKLDVSVLLIFFVRDYTFSQVFESIRQARPRRLLLWQDGPRKNRPDDLEGIRRCREIADSIDWDCEVYQNYHKENMGCDPSTFYAHKWAFSIVDKCIILEDDQVPSQSYYHFCKELLDKYENDERISHICGHILFGQADWCPHDYLFAKAGTGAWASWRRVADKWDQSYSFLNNQYDISNYSNQYGKKYCKKLLEIARKHQSSGIAYWETILGFGANLDSRYAIIPKYNLVENIGATAESTHTGIINDSRIISSGMSNSIYNLKTQEISMPLKHPDHIMLDAIYSRKMYDLQFPNRFKKMCNKLKILISIIKFRRFDLLRKIIRRN